MLVNESPLPELLKNQKSVYKLFPEFDARVSGVKKAGGVRLTRETPGVWFFRVHSATTKGAEYQVVFEFPDLKGDAVELARDARMWTKDKSAVDYNKLAGELINKTDIHIKCSCPAFQYWGFAYISSQNADIYGDKESRSPSVRNPDSAGEVCKHISSVYDQIPFYVSTLGSHLKRFFNKEVDAAVEKASGEREKLKKAAQLLKDKSKEIEKKPGNEKEKKG